MSMNFDEQPSGGVRLELPEDQVGGADPLEPGVDLGRLGLGHLDGRDSPHEFRSDESVDTLCFDPERSLEDGVGDEGDVGDVCEGGDVADVSEGLALVRALSRRRSRGTLAAPSLRAASLMFCESRQIGRAHV